MSDRIEDIRKGFLILLPVLDDRGRAIIYYDPALTEDQQEVVEDEVSRDSFFFSYDNHLIDMCYLFSIDAQVVQIYWYLIHVASENPSVRKNGFVLLCRFDDFRIRHLQPRRGLGM